MWTLSFHSLTCHFLIFVTFLPDSQREFLFSRQIKPVHIPSHTLTYTLTGDNILEKSLLSIYFVTVKSYSECYSVPQQDESSDDFRAAAEVLQRPEVTKTWLIANILFQFWWKVATGSKHYVIDALIKSRRLHIPKISSETDVWLNSRTVS